jgi:high-affinity nickel-transport protein
VTGVLGVVALGALLGVRHATDADHVVAVTTIVAREPGLRRAATVGALWGLGHSTTILVVGGTLIGLRVAMPPRVAVALELVVAAMLVLLGVRALRAARPAAAAPTPPGALRPLVIGTVHGLAGSAAVTLLVLASIRDPRWAVAYLAVFGLGTVVGMVGVTLLLAVPAAVAGARLRPMQRGLQLAAGTASLVLGVVMANALVRELAP